MKVILAMIAVFACSGTSYSEECKSDTIFLNENERLKNVHVGKTEKLIPIHIWGMVIYLPGRYIIGMKEGREGLSLSTNSKDLESYFSCRFTDDDFLYGSIDSGSVKDCSLCKEEGSKINIEKTKMYNFNIWTYRIPKSRPIVVIFDHRKYLKIVDKNDFIPESIINQMGFEIKRGNNKN